MGTVEQIFHDYKGRRAAIVKALTIDMHAFHFQCNPGRKKLCLYGYPDEHWEVKEPLKVFTEPPEPALGINLTRDRMERNNWLKMISIKSDLWLLSVTFFSKGQLDSNDRAQLFDLINELPTISDVVQEAIDSNTHMTNLQFQYKDDDEEENVDDDDEEENDDDDDAEHRESFCRRRDGNGLLWFQCDTCRNWESTKSGMMGTILELAGGVKHYKCKLCSANP